MESYSVLMSVYRGANPSFFAVAVQSMLNQTVPTDDFVIVCDGPLTEALDQVIEGFVNKYPELFHIVRLDENIGIGGAGNVGIKACGNDLIAKMDADDIALPDRCEKQLRRFAEEPKLAVLGGYIREFETDPEKAFSVRSVPLSNEEIRHFARRRQPFNNMTVMYRRSVVMSIGGYRKLRRGEDYDMYIRLLHAGYYAENLEDVLVNARVDKSAYARRASLSTLVGCVKSRWGAFKIGYSSLFDFLYCCAGELFIVICPGKIQQKVYMRFLRQHCETEQNEEAKA